MTAGPIQVALQVAGALDACEVPYTIGGSLASSISGEPRTTLDVDILVAMALVHVDPFIAALGGGFYADRDAILRAVRQKSTVNLIHQTSSVKVDLFMAGGSPLDEPQLARRQRVQVAIDPPKFLWVHSAEDILLQKLLWYRSGGEASDRQWRDVLGIFLVHGARLDREYLRKVAQAVGLGELLERAERAAQR